MIYRISSRQAAMVATIGILAIAFSELARADVLPNDAIIQPNVVTQPVPTIILPPAAPPRSESFDDAEQTVSPMSPDEVRRWKAYLESKQEAMYGGPPPKIISKMYPVSLDTGAHIPSVKIAPGYVTSIVLVDSYGNPWPIEDVPAVGNVSLYKVIVPKTADHNVITISARTAAGASNLSVSLKSEGLPINIQLQTDRHETVARADMQIQAKGPNTNTIDLGGGDVPTATPDNMMMAFLDGTPPGGAKEVHTSNLDMRAWVFGQMLYLRTKKTVLSPSWLGVSYGTAGLRVYRMQPTPMVLYSDAGQTKTISIDLNQPAMLAGADNQ